MRGTARGPGNYDGRRAPPVRPGDLLYSVARFPVLEKRRHGVALLGGQGFITVHACSYGSESFLIRHDPGGAYCGDFCAPLPSGSDRVERGEGFRPHLSADTPFDPDQVGGRAGQEIVAPLVLFPFSRERHLSCPTPELDEMEPRSLFGLGPRLDPSRHLQSGGQATRSFPMGPISRTRPTVCPIPWAYTDTDDVGPHDPCLPQWLCWTSSHRRHKSLYTGLRSLMTSLLIRASLTFSSESSLDIDDKYSSPQ